jgi:hypothetical protein
MIERARELTADTDDWKPHSEVRYLRASVIMHDLLQKFPASPDVAEAFYLTGLSYERLQDLGLWSLHEMYFQACIKKSPHSHLAEKCYQHYSDSVKFDFTGSRGTELPISVEVNLKKLRQLAAP